MKTTPKVQEELKALGIEVPEGVGITDNAIEADFIVCIRRDQPSPFTDNLYGFCEDCDCEVQFRPHMPVLVPKLCLECTLKRAE